MNNHPASGLAVRWADHLQHDRRRSPHTVRAYVATAHRLIAFLGQHKGEEIGSPELLGLSAADLRAFLAYRRAVGLGVSLRGITLLLLLARRRLTPLGVV